MYQHMPYAFNNIPINLWMSFPEFLCEHINSFSYNLNVLYKSEEYDWVVFNIHKFIFILIIDIISIEDRICSSLPLSLIFSRIYKLFILFYTHFSKWEETTLLHYINLAVEFFAQ